MPTILKIGLDAGDYEKELQKVVDQTKELQAKTAQTNSVSVKVDPSDMSDLSDVSDKVEELEGTHEVKVNVKTSGAEKLPKSIAKAKDEAGGLVDQLKESSDGADMLGDMFLGAGGKVEILKKGVESVGKIIAWAFEQADQKMHEATELAQQNAASIAEVAAKREEESKQTLEVINRIQELNNVEKLSNVQKTEMISLLEKMGGGYKNLGLQIDQATGKIKNFDEVSVDAMKQDLQRRIDAKKSEELSLRSVVEQAEIERDNAGVSVSKILKYSGPQGFLYATIFNRFLKDYRIGGKEAIQEAGKTITSANDRIVQLIDERNELKKQLAALPGQHLAAGKAANADAREAINAGIRSFDRQKHDDAFADSTDTEDRLKNRQKLLDEALRKKADLERRMSELEKNAPNLTGEARVSAEREYLAAKKELLAVQQEIYGLERQMASVRKQAADQAAAEAAAKAEEAKRKREEAKRKREEEARLAEQKAAEEARQKAGLKGYFVGQVRQVGLVGHVGQALKDARAAKGAELTDKESEAVRKIAKLTYSMNSRRENDPGDLSIKTNSLTARGGFQGGAVAPDLERYNRITAENSRQTLARMRTLETNVAKILRIFEG